MLEGADFHRGKSLREAASANRARREAVRDLDLPLTATREEIEALAARAESGRREEVGGRLFPGIALGPAVVEGRAVKAADLAARELAGEIASRSPDAVRGAKRLFEESSAWADHRESHDQFIAEIVAELNGGE